MESFNNRLLPEAVEEDSALDGPCCNQEVEANRGPAVSFEEDHQIAEADEHHNMNVLPHGVVEVNVRIRCSLLGRDFSWVCVPCVPVLGESGSNTVENDHNCFGKEKEYFPSP